MSLGRQPGSWVLMELLSQQTPVPSAAPEPALPGSRDAPAHTVPQELLPAAFSVPVSLTGDRAGPALPLHGPTYTPLPGHTPASCLDPSAVAKAEF